MPEANFLTPFTSTKFQAWVQDFRAQAAVSSKNLTTKDYIRLLVIVGGYCLLRPYLVKLGGRFQASDHERELDDTDILSPAAVSPNSLRGQIDVPDDSASEEEAGGVTNLNWGRNARRRQRKMIKSMVEAEEKRRAEEEEADSDKEIEEFLRKVID